MKKEILTLNTYTELHFQIVFAVKFKEALIENKWENELYRYITAVVQNDWNRHKMLAINGKCDHIHLLIGMRPHQSISDLVREIKSAASRWINDRGHLRHRFEWQKGYGCFSYGKNEVKGVINDVMNQKRFHLDTSFLDEYRQLLREFEIDFDERYLFHEPI